MQGHFPQLPIVPGIILCEMMCQSASFLFDKENMPKLTGMDNVKFKRKVSPGNEVIIKNKIKNRTEARITVKSEGYADGIICISSDIFFEYK